MEMEPELAKSENLFKEEKFQISFKIVKRERERERVLQADQLKLSFFLQKVLPPIWGRLLFFPFLCAGVFQHRLKTREYR